MLQTMLIKLGFVLFRLLPPERRVAKVLTATIQRIMLSKKTAAQVRKAGIHLTELIDPMREAFAAFLRGFRYLVCALHLTTRVRLKFLQGFRSRAYGDRKQREAYEIQKSVVGIRYPAVSFNADGL